MTDKHTKNIPQESQSNASVSHSDAGVTDKIIEELNHFIEGAEPEGNLDHRAKFKDEDGCARYDDLWGG